MQVKETHVVTLAEYSTGFGVLEALILLGAAIAILCFFALFVSGDSKWSIGTVSGVIVVITCLLVLDAFKMPAETERQYEATVEEIPGLTEANVKDGHRLTASDSSGGYVSGFVYQEGDNLIVVILEG